MKLILNCTTRNELGLCAYAFVDLTPQLAQLILRRIASLQALQVNDRDADYIAYNDYSPTWFGGREDNKHTEEWWETLKDISEDVGFKEVLDCTEEDFKEVKDRTECDRMIVRNDQVFFECNPKHLDHPEETYQIFLETLHRAAMEEGIGKCVKCGTQCVADGSLAVICPNQDCEQHDERTACQYCGKPIEISEPSTNFEGEHYHDRCIREMGVGR